MHYGEVVDMIQEINNVTLSDCREFIENCYRSPTTYIVLGGDTHDVPNADWVGR